VAERAEDDERIERGPPTPERVGNPNPGKAAPLDLPGIFDDAMERTAARFPLRPHKGHDTPSHDHPPGENFAATKSSFLNCDNPATMHHIGRGGQQPIAHVPPPPGAGATPHRWNKSEISVMFVPL